MYVRQIRISNFISSIRATTGSQTCVQFRTLARLNNRFNIPRSLDETKIKHIWNKVISTTSPPKLGDLEAVVQEFVNKASGIVVEELGSTLRYKPQHGLTAPPLVPDCLFFPGYLSVPTWTSALVFGELKKCSPDMDSYGLGQAIQYLMNAQQIYFEARKNLNNYV